mgnify:CR=1 FL=1
MVAEEVADAVVDLGRDGRDVVEKQAEAEDLDAVDDDARVRRLRVVLQRGLLDRRHRPADLGAPRPVLVAAAARADDVRGRDVGGVCGAEAAERTLGAIRLGARSEEGLARPQERRRRDRLERVRRLRRVVGMQHLLRRARPEAWNGAGGGCARTRTSARSTVL